MIEGYSKIILETFAWTSVLLLATYATSIISGVLFAPVIGLFVGSATAFLLAYIIIPLVIYFYRDVTNPSMPDTDVRFELLLFAVAEGALTGFLLSERYLASMQPMTFITPFFIAVIGNLAETKIGTERKTILGATIGISVSPLISLLNATFRLLSMSFLGSL